MTVTPTRNLSKYAGYVRCSPKAYGDNEPMDTAHALDLVNNIQALQQGSMQIRVNTDTPMQYGAKDTPWNLSNTPGVIASIPFELTVLANGCLAPVYVQLRVANINATQSVVWSCRLRRKNVPITYAGVPGASISPLLQCTSIVPTTLTTVIYLPAANTGDPNPLPVRTRQTDTLRNGTANSYLCFLDIFVNVPTASNNVKGFVLYGVTVREIPFQVGT